MTLESLDDDYRASGPLPVLCSARLILRPVDVRDADRMVILANDKRVTQNTARLPFPYTREAALSWMETVTSSSPGAFAVTLKSGEMLGVCGAAHVNDRLFHIGYWLGVMHWGKGYATEAIQRFVDYLFSDHAVDMIGAEARVSNPASRRVLEKCGFQWAGAGLTRIVSLQSSVPVDKFCLERRTWRGLKSWGRIEQ